MRKKAVLIIILIFFGALIILNLPQADDKTVRESSKNDNIPEINIPNCPDCNVILISLDTLRADRLGCYGYERNTSSNIDDFAENSILFKNTFSNAYFTLPSHMSIFTSLYPITHKINNPFSESPNQPLNKLSEDYLTMAEIMKNNGYSTTWAAPLNNSYLNLERGFERGFDEKYSTLFEKGSWGSVSGLNHESLLKMIEKGKEGKFFWFVHSYIDHAPYIYPEEYNYIFSSQDYEGNLPDEFPTLNKLYFQEIVRLYKEEPEIMSEKFNKIKAKQKTEFIDTIITEDLDKYLNLIENISFKLELRDTFDLVYVSLYYSSISDNISESDVIEISNRYDNGVIFNDILLGEFFSELKKNNLWNNTIIIITSDQGDQLYENGDFDHTTFYDHTIHVPLIIKVPGMESGMEVDKMTQSVDILPTLLDLLDIDGPEQMQGKSYLNYSNQNNYVYGYSLGSYYIRSSEWKYIITREGNIGLYNLKDDPLEQNNMIEDRNSVEIKKNMEEEITRWTINQEWIIYQNI